MKYATRAWAAFCLLSIALWVTSRIGEPSSCTPLTWGSAWAFIATLAVSGLVGWLAALEYARNKA